MAWVRTATSSPTATCARTWVARSATTPMPARFKCPCHFSVFDAEMHGQMICGQATENLPRIQLALEREGRLHHRDWRDRPDLRPSRPTPCKEEHIMTIGKDRIALPPVGAQKTNMTCHFCIVGCGYHVYKWDENPKAARRRTRTRWGWISASSCRRLPSRSPRR